MKRSKRSVFACFKSLNVLMFLAMILAVGMIASSCGKEPIKAADLKKENNVAFTLPVKYTVKDGILSFESKDDFDKALTAICLEENSTIENWEDQHGFYSLKHYFEDIILAEDAVENEIFKLPLAEQEAYKNAPQIYSDLYKDALSKGIIKEVIDPDDGSTYWDYGVSDPSFAPLLNTDGMVIIGGELVWFDNNGFGKIIKDGDFAKLDEIKAINKNFDNEFFHVMKFSKKGNTQKFGSSYSFPRYNNWRYPTSKKRVKAWVDGSSAGYIKTTSGPCEDEYLTQRVTFILRLQAQKKNFWGNWKYTSYYPSANIDDGNWNYNYSYYHTGCFGSYSTASDGLNNSFPTPLWDAYYPTVNNAYLKMNPHTDGMWGSPGEYLRCVINVYNYNIPVTYGGYGASTWDLTH